MDGDGAPQKTAELSANVFATDMRSPSEFVAAEQSLVAACTSSMSCDERLRLVTHAPSEHVSRGSSYEMRIFDLEK